MPRHPVAGLERRGEVQAARSALGYNQRPRRPPPPTPKPTQLTARSLAPPDCGSGAVI